MEEEGQGGVVYLSVGGHIHHVLSRTEVDSLGGWEGVMSEVCGMCCVKCMVCEVCDV